MDGIFGLVAESAHTFVLLVDAAVLDSGASRLSVLVGVAVGVASPLKLSFSRPYNTKDTPYTRPLPYSSTRVKVAFSCKVRK